MYECIDIWNILVQILHKEKQTKKYFKFYKPQALLILR
jgi:hypothetical protein